MTAPPSHWLWLLPLAPLVGGGVNLLLAKRLPVGLRERAVAGVAIGALALTGLCSLFALFALLSLEPEARRLVAPGWAAASGEGFVLRFGLALDPLSMVPVLVVSWVGLLIHVYSAGYMAKDEAFPRFFAHLNFFVAAMLLLVLADGFPALLLGWEGVGLMSYLLIGFWFRDLDKAQAGLKAFVTNRVGDVGLLVGVCLLASELSTFQFDALQARAQALSPEVSTAACLLLFVGACAKSAQIPLQAWLPDAMAGPTPVSALIHAATLVTAGVYLLARLHFLLVLSPLAMAVVASVGAATAVYGAAVALGQDDLKRVLAYSTVSQLGFMFLGLGTGGFGAALFHLVTHACFKACLFLGAGAAIHACHGEQDLRRMGGLRHTLPTTARSYAYACVALSGLPFASGFFSKDAILWSAFDAGRGVGLSWLGPALGGLGLAAAFATSLYSWRSYHLAFGGQYRGEGSPHDVPRSMRGVQLLLAVLCLLTAALGFWPPLGHALHVEALREPLLARWLEPVLAPSLGLLGPLRAGMGLFAEVALAAVSVAVASGGFLLARHLFAQARGEVPQGLRARLPGLHLSLARGLGFDAFNARWVVAPVRSLGRLLMGVDRHLLDGFLLSLAWSGRAGGRLHAAVDLRIVDGVVNGVATAFSRLGGQVRRAQTGQLGHYVLVALAGALLLFGLGHFLGG